MRKRESSIITFIALFVFILFVFILRDSGWSKGMRSIFEQILSPLQSFALSVSTLPSNLSTNKQLEKLQKENRNLLSRQAELERLRQDNAALNDQFALVNPKPSLLIPAKIVGMPQFVPGITYPDEIILGIGSLDGIKEGLAVVSKDQLIGKILRTSEHRSVAMLISNKNSSITVKNSATGALGLLKGMGGRDMILDNVVLSESLNISDIIVTKGDQNENGIGIAPDLVVGKIVSVSKKASDLFQSASVKSLTDVTKLPVVFVLNQ